MVDVEHAQIRDGEGRALDILGPDSAQPGARRHRSDFLTDLAKRLEVRLAHNDGEQSLVHGHSDANVHLGMADERVAEQGSVEPGDVAQRQRRRLDDEVVDREPGIFRLDGIQLRPQVDQIPDVQIASEVEVRDLLLG